MSGLSKKSESSRREAFHLEKYKALRQELLVKMQHEFDIQKWTIVAVGLLYATGFTLDSAHIDPNTKQ
jgi:hypothetical protein